MIGGECLRAEDVSAVPSDLVAPLLAYLNLPPAGGLADAAGPIAIGSDAAYELPGPLRRSLLERRARCGRFRSPEDLVGISGCGPTDLRALLDRLGNLPRYGNRVRPVWGGPEGLRELFALVESANTHVHVSTYILGGAVGRRLAAVLARKQRDGVRVRLLFCANGLVTSGAPSGTGSASRWSTFRSHYVNDHYARRRILQDLDAAGVSFLNSAPIGRHWRRPALRKRGITGPAEYGRWARASGVPDEWLTEQTAIDRACAFAFAHVDHRKMVIVDGARAFIGGQNIADNYLYANALSTDPDVNIARWQWHDNSAIVEGAIVGELNELFARRWILSGGDFFDARDALYAPPAIRAGDAIVTAVASIPGMLRLPVQRNLPRLLATMVGADVRPATEGSNPIRARMLQLPELATEELLAEHCYPTDAELLERWASAIRSEVPCTLIVPAHCDSIVLGYECRRFYPELIAAGFRLQRFDQAILHSKIAVADRWYTALGSYNLNLRSGRSDLELQFFVQSPEYGAAVAERLEEDLKRCVPAVAGLVDRYRSRRSVPFFDALVRYAFL